MDTTSAINVTGSAAIITECVKYAVNAILFQRGLDSTEQFASVEKYGIKLPLSTNEIAVTYLNNAWKAMHDYMVKGQLTKVVFLIINQQNKEVLERWEFLMTVEEAPDKGDDLDLTEPMVSSKPLKKIKAEFRDLMDQIAVSSNYLPLLNGKCAIELLLFIEPSASLTENWCDGVDRPIPNPQVVGLQTVATGIHTMKPYVCCNLLNI